MRILVSSFPAIASPLLLVLLATLSLGARADHPSFENLKRIENADMAAAFIDPNADFSVYGRVMILEPHVAFRANWQRDQRKEHHRVTKHDMEQIRAAASELLLEAFIEALEAHDGFEVVDAPDHDVLLVRPALLDLDVTAPETNEAGRSRNFSTSAGAATIYLELYDSVTGQIIGRAADRRAASRPGGMMMYSNRVTNRRDAKRMFRVWADRLRGFMDDHYRGN